MDQFQTVLLGGYRKDLVDERLKTLVAQIEELRKEARAAGERESELKEQLAEALNRAEAAESASQVSFTREDFDGGDPAGAASAPPEDLEEAARREAQLKKKLAEALARLNALEEALERGDETGEAGARVQERQQREQMKEELAAAHRWAESLEAELKAAREEKDARARKRIEELERVQMLSRRVLDLENEKERMESEHKWEVARLREEAERLTRSSVAAERILSAAEEEARSLLEEAQNRAQELERRTDEEIRTKRQEAAKALEGARAQVIQYLEAFNVTRDKLAVTYNELDALVEKMPRSGDAVFDLERDVPGGNWSYLPDTED